MKVSGVALLEQKLSTSKPEYEAYKKNTPAFFPKLF
jgi:steroid 5-alpha reductase family enzyme